jgi:GntR family transcriptional regulator/MocR family aminotransferase
MRTPDGVSAAALAERLKGDSVLIEPGGPFFGTPEDGDRFYRIAYSSITSERIPEGIARIARMQAAMTGKPRRAG